MNEQLEQALSQIADEKGISQAEIISMIEASLAAAFRKDYGEKNQNIVVEFNPENLSTKVFDVKTVVEDMPPEEEKTPEQLAAEAEEAERKMKEAQAAGAYLALPPVEIRPKTAFFDFQAKYEGKSEEIVPATFADQVKRSIQDLSKKIHSALGLRH